MFGCFVASEGENFRGTKITRQRYLREASGTRGDHEPDVEGEIAQTDKVMDKARLCWLARGCRRYSVVGSVHSDDDQRFGIQGSMGMGGMAEPVGEQPHRIRGVVAAQ